MTQSWLYEGKGSYFLKTYRLSFTKDLKVESLEFSHDQKVMQLAKVFSKIRLDMKEKIKNLKFKLNKIK
ncbi:hypothetical protein BpHYR1_046585 [Brachionus plicatilis]|uniref:Uncharacterized protein n=1 Tax=Brachionus plicatilis TaxID=10195 RepID=A0A3M7RU34_BRAPC|nr:hypothetical protein BpHYR1_046585 [Brachionus plicatilis]